MSLLISEDTPAWDMGAILRSFWLLPSPLPVCFALLHYVPALIFAGCCSPAMADWSSPLLDGDGRPDVKESHQVYQSDLTPEFFQSEGDLATYLPRAGPRPADGGMDHELSTGVPRFSSSI